MINKDAFFSNRFQATLFEEYLSLEFAFVMNSFHPNGDFDPTHKIQSSQYITLSASDAKELAILLTDLYLNREKETGAPIEVREPFKTLWDNLIRKEER